MLHMNKVHEDLPGSTVAPRALYWLGAQALAGQNYGQAQTTFQELISRYPDSEYVGRAKEYINRLSAVIDEQ